MQALVHNPYNPVREFIPLHYPFNHHMGYGMGLGGPVIGQQGAAIASIAATAVATTGTILAGLATAGTFLATAGGPIGAAVAALIGISVVIANMFGGCGDTCVEASNLANQFGQVMTDNLNHYVNSPVRYRSMQRAALNNYDIGWAALSKACGNQALMQAGVNCIADRQEGACKWKAAYPGAWNRDTNGNWVWSGYGPPVTDGSGVCWNYFIGMRDPIANDPGVVDDPPTDIASQVGSSISDTFSNLMPSGLQGSGGMLLLIGALGLGGLFFMSQGDK